VYTYEVAFWTRFHGLHGGMGISPGVLVYHLVDLWWFTLDNIGTYPDTMEIMIHSRFLAPMSSFTNSQQPSH
jgi:hypothetical protein